ncbi:hypothetical protein V6N11_040849 [Hibiscus sabdariffa]|uniref:Uncharacterized protein n=1 Tax=Hibiscus sabdariffa TaxID=183260 RepID=A0ABR2RJ55_9ROSI
MGDKRRGEHGVRVAPGMSFPLVDGATQVCLDPQPFMGASSNSRVDVGSSRSQHMQDTSHVIGDEIGMNGQNSQMMLSMSSRSSSYVPPARESNGPAFDTIGSTSSNETDINAASNDTQRLLSRSSNNEKA